MSWIASILRQKECTAKYEYHHRYECVVKMPVSCKAKDSITREDNISCTWKVAVFPVTRSFIHSFTHSFIHSFIHPFIHTFIHSLFPPICEGWYSPRKRDIPSYQQLLYLSCSQVFWCHKSVCL